MRLVYLSCSLFLVKAMPAHAQPANDDCSTASSLCADQPVNGDNTGANTWPGFCDQTANVLWYTFATNSLGGPVDIDLSNINCPPVTNMDNELSMVVLSGDGSCAPGSFTAVSPCTQDSVDFTLITDPLLPNTQYWAIVAGVADNGSTIPAECSFTIATSGPGIGNFVDIGGDLILCPGDAALFFANDSATSYLWQDGSTDQIFIMSEAGEVSVFVTDLTGCTDSDTAEVSFLTGPPEPTIEVVGADLVATGIGNFHWYLNGLPISGANAATYTPTENGLYAVTVTDQVGCSTYSVALDLQTVGVGPVNASSISIGPNPAVDRLTVTVPPRDWSVNISDAMGNLLITERITGTTTLDVSALAVGIYFLELRDLKGERQRIFRVVRN